MMSLVRAQQGEPKPCISVRGFLFSPFWRFGLPSTPVGRLPPTACCASCRRFAWGPPRSHGRLGCSAEPHPRHSLLGGDHCGEKSPQDFFRLVTQQGEPKSPSRTTWTFSFVPQAQHHLTEGQHHFERSENIIPHEAAQMNDVALCANDVMLRINEVALRANGELQFCCTLTQKSLIFKDFSCFWG